MEFLLRKEAVSETLGVSLATVNNWIKTKVIPSPDVELFYSRNTFDNIIDKVKNDHERLNSRANRTLQKGKAVCFLGIKTKERKDLLINLINDFEESAISVTEGVLALSFAILRSNNIIDTNWKKNKSSHLDKLLSEWIAKSHDHDKIKNFYARYKIANLDDDILGAFYQSILNISEKSNSGSYYTAAELLHDIKISANKTVLDPCCGSGSILLKILSKNHAPSKIFARDIDETALKICFINLVLFFNDRNVALNIIKHDITENSSNDLFYQSDSDKFDYIITNPPWGSKFTAQQKEHLYKLYPDLNTSEIFSIALYNAIKMLAHDGELYFFLPHSFLNVATHKQIRQHIFNSSHKIHIKILGKAFKGVLSDSILLHIKKSNDEKKVFIESTDGSNHHIFLTDITSPNFIVSATSKAIDTLIINKIFNIKHVTLHNDTIFALGIVTGNNAKFISEEKTSGSEAIFRGKDIAKYNFLKEKYYIKFDPTLFQQTAQEQYYRQDKIVYRFISDKLVFVLDKENRLLLNSANLFIPKHYPMETIVSLFNSDIYTFIFRKLFHSTKVLKSHLQKLPLPILSESTHVYIYNLYNDTFSCNGKDLPIFQMEIDKILCKAVSIDEKEYRYIKEQI